MKWHEQCVVHFTWARHGRPMTAAWVDAVLRRAVDLSAEAMIFGIQLGGHVAYKSRVSPPIPDMEGDVLARLCKSGHKLGLKIIPYWLTTSGGCAVEALEHPDWLSIGPDGERLGHLCYNTPFGEFQEAQVREVLSAYAVDGIFFDQLSAACYCVYCLNAYRSEYGREMPRETVFGRYPGQAFLEDSAQADQLREFRTGNARRWCRRIRTAVDETRPGTVYVQNWLFGPAVEACAEFVDAVLPEQHLSTDLNATPIGNRIVGAYGPAVWANVSHLYPHHAKLHTVDHTQLLLTQGAAVRCSPNVIELNAFDDNTGGYADFKEAMRQVRWTSDALKDCSPVKYAAVLHSGPSDIRNPEDFRAAVDGVYDLLASGHVPFEFISETGIQKGGLEGFSVLVMANATHVSDATLAAVRRFVAAGGGLVATHMSGAYDENGRRRTSSPIADLAGVAIGSINAWTQNIEYPSVDAQVPIPSIDFRPGRPFFRYVTMPGASPLADGLEGRLMSFSGPFVEVAANAGAKVAANIHEMDQALLNMRPYNRRGLFPGAPRWPLVTLRQGRGRVAYIAAFLEPKAHRTDCYEMDRLFTNTVIWAGGTPPISAVNVPPTVHFTLNRGEDDERLVLVATNQTTHQLDPAGHRGSIRYVVPLADLEFRLRIPGRKRIAAAETASGQTATLTRQGSETVVKIPRLGVAECVTLRY